MNYTMTLLFIFFPGYTIIIIFNLNGMYNSFIILDKNHNVEKAEKAIRKVDLNTGF